jgi:hypothetical protein
MQYRDLANARRRRVEAGYSDIRHVSFSPDSSHMATAEGSAVTGVARYRRFDA